MPPAPPIAPAPSGVGQLLPHLVWWLIPLGILGYLVVVPAVRRSVADMATRTADAIAPRRRPPAAVPVTAPPAAATEAGPAGLSTGEETALASTDTDTDAPDPVMVDAITAAYLAGPPA